MYDSSMQSLILIGDRINLRPPVPSDARSMATYANHKLVAPAVGSMPFPYTLTHAKQFIALAQENWDNGTEAQFGIEDKNTGKLIGMIGLTRIATTHKNAEMGYWLGKPFWGQGLASEAVSMMLEYAFGDMKLHRVYSRVRSKNIASQKVLERAGFIKEGCFREHIKHQGRWDDLLWYGKLRTDR